tara:strand:+ start:1866 stop:2063 length:198 start_codon:yes stop_codon:yes gene_type:complete
MDNIIMNEEVQITLSKKFMVNTIIHLSLLQNMMSSNDIFKVRELYDAMTIDQVKNDFEQLKTVYE